MTARSSNTELQNLTRGLQRITLPVLAPALGFDGDVEYARQVELWQQWIAWEKDDPLVLKEEDESAYKTRILYTYRQALMALRFWPEMWCDAADFCFANGLDSDGNDFLSNGAAANPESCLLALKRADRIESTMTTEEGEESIVRKGKAVREPLDKVLEALYSLINKIKEREVQTIARINEDAASRTAMIAQQAQVNSIARANGYDDPEDTIESSPEDLAKSQTEALINGNAAQVKLISRTISFIWIAMMRAMRRVQGKGKVGEPIGGSRQVFTDARAKGRLTSDVYVASALIEHHCYKDPAATKIFDRGMKLFKEDEQFALEYLKHLIAINDTTSKFLVFLIGSTQVLIIRQQMLVPSSRPQLTDWLRSRKPYLGLNLCTCTSTISRRTTVSSARSPSSSNACKISSRRTRSSPCSHPALQARGSTQSPHDQ